MQIDFDPKYNIAYIKFFEKEGEVRTLSLSDDMNVDLSADGKVFGIELLNANEQLQTQDKFTLFNLAQNKTDTLSWI